MLNVTIVVGILTFGVALFVSFYRQAVATQKVVKLKPSKVERIQKRIKELKRSKLIFSVPTMLIAIGVLYITVEVTILTGGYNQDLTPIIASLFTLIVISITQVNRLADKLEVEEDKLKEV